MCSTASQLGTHVTWFQNFLSCMLHGLTVAASRSSSSDSETEQPLRKQPRTDGGGAAARTGLGLQTHSDMRSPAAAALAQPGAAALAAGGAGATAQARSMTGEPLGAAGSAGLAAAGARAAAQPQSTDAEPSGVPGSAALAAAGTCPASQAHSLVGGSMSASTDAGPGGLAGAALGFQAALVQRVGASSVAGPVQKPGLGVAVGSEAAIKQPGWDGACEGGKGVWEGEAGSGSGSELTDGAGSGKGSRGSSQTRSGPAAANRSS